MLTFSIVGSCPLSLSSSLLLSSPLLLSSSSSCPLSVALILLRSAQKDRKNHEGAGDLDLIDDDDDILEEADAEVDKSLPGVQSGYYSNKRKKAKVGATEVAFSPSGREWVCTTSEGLLTFSLDSQVLFSPTFPPRVVYLRLCLFFSVTCLIRSC